MDMLLETIKQACTVWARSQDDVIFHMTREKQFGSWDGMDDEKLAELLACRYADYVWSFSPYVMKRHDVWGEPEHVTVPTEILATIRFKYGVIKPDKIVKIHCPDNPGHMLYAVCAECERKQFHAYMTERTPLEDQRVALIELPKVAYQFLINDRPRPINGYVGRCHTCKTIFWTLEGDVRC